MFAVLPKICFSTSTFQDFCLDLFCSYLWRSFQNFTNFCFPENLLVAAANCFKVLKIFISPKIYIYSKTWPSSLLYIQQRRIQNPFQRLSKVISLEVTIFIKNTILDVWKGYEYVVAQYKANTNQKETLKQAT